MSRTRPSNPREAILDQLAYLVDEIEAVEPLISRLPDDFLSARSWSGEPSIKELYATIAAADEDVRMPNFQRIIGEDDPELLPLNESDLAGREPWNELALGVVLRRVREAREKLTAFLRALPQDEWTRTGVLSGTRRTIYDLAFLITQEDTDLFRTLGQRLHESHITLRAQDLPK